MSGGGGGRGCEGKARNGIQSPGGDKSGNYRHDGKQREHGEHAEKDHDGFHKSGHHTAPASRRRGRWESGHASRSDERYDYSENGTRDGRQYYTDMERRTSSRRDYHDGGGAYEGSSHDGWNEYQDDGWDEHGHQESKSYYKSENEYRRQDTEYGQYEGERENEQGREEAWDISVGEKYTEDRHGTEREAGSARINNHRYEADYGRYNSERQYDNTWARSVVDRHGDESYAMNDGGDEGWGDLPTQFTSSKEQRRQRMRGGVCKPKQHNRRDLAKYESQRHRLFHRFDEGIRMDAVSWYSVTPEKIAAHIARRFRAALPPGAAVVDAFCGAGGNAIQFAGEGLWVLGVELARGRVDITRHNAEVYGVGCAVDIIHANAYHILPALRAVDAVFLSPPWGGPDYAAAGATFDLAVFAPLVALARNLSPNVAILVPRNIDCEQARQLFGECEIEYNYLGAPRKLKTVTIYFGALAVLDETEGHTACAEKTADVGVEKAAEASATKASEKKSGSK